MALMSSDYCDVYLTHDSMSVRKAHNSGRNHLRNVVEYYQQIGHEKAQDVIDSITNSYNAEGQAANNPMNQPLPGMGGPGPGGFPPFFPGQGMPPFPPPGGGPGGFPGPGGPLPAGLPFPPPGGLPNFPFPPPNSAGPAGSPPANFPFPPPPGAGGMPNFPFPPPNMMGGPPGGLPGGGPSPLPPPGMANGMGGPPPSASPGMGGGPGMSRDPRLAGPPPS
ncbi:zf-U1-domain-containing protein [Aulographum hederae CBS 113979]|uniref:U1 small nuclear ribonucleoprotein C n=1 Tax=Aulographum hederae CBS 113979 TaxID=1176131 RepID=A0A6G1GJW1_9PEZI|nr:zf-U1-domain-containing protein [Aulographum hederae CBS 113979]